jgi:acyl-coenzyme A thioesterase PaaI-like protein
VPKAAAIRAQVLRGISGNRNPGFHFAGYFLDFDWSRVTSDNVEIAIGNGPHVEDSMGAIAIAPLAVLADNALGTCIRRQMGPGARLATITMQMGFTGIPAMGRVRAEAKLLGTSRASALRQSFAAATLIADAGAVCYASGEFAALEPPPGVDLAPLPWQYQTPPEIPPLREDELEPEERAILSACDHALALTSPTATFIQHFWGCAAETVAQGSRCRVPIGPEIGNRVGHVQGGISFGIAAAAACAAAPAEMKLSGAAAWYISPGRGKALNVQSRALHVGRQLAVIRTEIKNPGGQRVLEVVTHHVAKSG